MSTEEKNNEAEKKYSARPQGLERRSALFKLILKLSFFPLIFLTVALAIFTAKYQDKSLTLATPTMTQPTQRPVITRVPIVSPPPATATSSPTARPTFTVTPTRTATFTATFTETPTIPPAVKTPRLSGSQKVHLLFPALFLSGLEWFQLSESEPLVSVRNFFNTCNGSLTVTGYSGSSEKKGLGMLRAKKVLSYLSPLYPSRQLSLIGKDKKMPEVSSSHVRHGGQYAVTLSCINRKKENT